VLHFSRRVLLSFLPGVVYLYLFFLDYQKPFISPYFHFCINVQILRLILQLDEAEQRLQVLSHTDELTQTYNQRYFMQYIDQEFKRAQRYGGTFSIAILDVDNFKEINDRWGHLVGDQVLRTLTRMFRECIRQALRVNGGRKSAFGK
jgi:predicted signal transduction protein with EAL and GGDEF domain